MDQSPIEAIEPVKAIEAIEAIELDLLVKSLKDHANAGTLTLQMEQDAIDQYEHDSDAIARICDAVFPDNLILDPNFKNEVVFFSDM